MTAKLKQRQVQSRKRAINFIIGEMTLHHTRKGVWLHVSRDGRAGEVGLHNLAPAQ